MKSELISIDKVADMLDISKTGVRSLIKNDFLKTKNSQVLRQSVIELIDMRDDALTMQDILKYLNISHKQSFYDLVRHEIFPKADFRIGFILYWKVETVRGYL